MGKLLGKGWERLGKRLVEGWGKGWGKVGEMVGAKFGERLGERLGEKVGEMVGEKVGEKVGGKVGGKGWGKGRELTFLSGTQMTCRRCQRLAQNCLVHDVSAATLDPSHAPVHGDNDHAGSQGHTHVHTDAHTWMD